MDSLRILLLIASVGALTEGMAAEPAHDITIPAGTRISLRLGSSVSSASSRVEDPVQATLRSPIVIDGVTVLPAGTASADT